MFKNVIDSNLTGNSVGTIVQIDTPKGKLKAVTGTVFLITIKQIRKLRVKQ